MSQSTFLQTTEWLNFQRALGARVFEYDQDGVCASVIRRQIALGKNYLYLPHGPELDFNAMTGGIDNAVRRWVAWLKQIARGEKSIFVIPTNTGCSNSKSNSSNVIHFIYFWSSITHANY